MKPALSRLAKRRGIRYIAAGSAATLTEYLSFLLLYYIVGTVVVPANIISFLLGLMTSFTLQKLWVFGDVKQSGRTHNQAGVYGLVAVLNVTFSSIAVSFLLQQSVPAFIAKLILIAAIASWNYWLFKRLVFVGKQKVD